MMFLGMAKAGVAPLMLNRHLAPREWLWILARRRAAPSLRAGRGGGRGAETAARGSAAEHRLRRLRRRTARRLDDWRRIPGGRRAGQAEARRHRRRHLLPDLHQRHDRPPQGRDAEPRQHHRPCRAEHGRVPPPRAGRAARLVVTPLSTPPGVLRIMTARINGATSRPDGALRPAEFRRTIERERINTFNMVPSMIQRC